MKNLHTQVGFFTPLRFVQNDAPLIVRMYYVYIMTNKSRTLYTGMTNDLGRRVYEHKNKLVPGFTSRYNITKLMYFESTSDALSAIAREKQIKGWLRTKKIALIESANPEWRDLGMTVDVGSYPSSLRSSG